MFAHDTKNRLISVTSAATASFVYDGDGKQVKAMVNGTTTVYVGNHYEVKNSVVTKYYFAGTTRLAVRTGGTLSYLLGDHLGSSSVTTDANGVKTASALYKAFGETRYTLGNLNTDYQFTGQRLQAELGIYWFQSRWYDGSLGRFLSPDTIVPTSTQGTQAWDRYAFVNNNPVRYNDPTGHQITGEKCGLDDCESWGSAGTTGSTSSSNNGGGNGDGGGSKPQNSPTKQSNDKPQCEGFAPFPSEDCINFSVELTQDDLYSMANIAEGLAVVLDVLFGIGAAALSPSVIGPIAILLFAGFETWELFSFADGLRDAAKNMGPNDTAMLTNETQTPWGLLAENYHVEGQIGQTRLILPTSRFIAFTLSMVFGN